MFFNSSLQVALGFVNVTSIIDCTSRGGSRTAATSKMECVVIIVNGFQPLTIITKRSILDVAAALDPPLTSKLVNNIGLKKFRDRFFTTGKTLNF